MDNEKDLEQQREENGPQYRVISGEIRAVTKEEDNKSFELSFSSEKPVSRWWNDEILLHEKDSVDLEALREAGSVLFSHGRDTVIGRAPIARIDEVWLDESNRKCRAKITFDDDENSERIRKKVAGGFLKGVSLGYTVSSWEEVRANTTSSNGRFTGPVDIALRWEPFEISFEPTPADTSVGIGRGRDRNKNEVENNVKSDDEKYLWNLRKKINCYEEEK